MSYQSILDLDCNHCSPSARQLLYFEEVVFLAVLVLLLGCRQCNEHICIKLLFSGMLNDALMHREGLKGFKYLFRCSTLQRWDQFLMSDCEVKVDPYPKSTMDAHQKINHFLDVKLVILRFV